MTEIAIIGGGAAGMMAAVTAARNGATVTVFEKNAKIGRKLMITGKGRCNITNVATGEELLSQIAHNPRFMYSAFSSFDTRDTMEFFENIGVPLKVERGGRVFPQSDRAVTVVDALYNEARRLNVKIEFDSTVKTIEKNEKFTVCGKEFDKVIICTGGKSYPLTGSTGDGYALARDFGHTVTDITPSLVPLTSPDGFCSRLSGLSLKNVVFSLVDENGKTAFSEMGEMLFCHFGISGPLCLSASAKGDFAKHTYTGVIDLKPALSHKQLEDRVLRDFAENQNKEISNVIGGLTPHNLGIEVLNQAGIPQNTKINAFTKEMRKSLCETLKAFKVHINGTRPIDEAIITRGGINVKEINPKTFESKLVSGLYFAGEILDVDAYTGGFNLQIAFSSAYSAAVFAAGE
ncbi:MAG: NAD(P)/FAD-dependent oxidoreductase [Oscillospiraceae bacterium]|nr:NAD(P)/FAD-dependent oxidoreductase [Candidatus Equicaccousia limihippi]